jgi:hypothetical protein
MKNVWYFINLALKFLTQLIKKFEWHINGNIGFNRNIISH